MTIAVAIPMLDELCNISMLLTNLRRQTFRQFCVYVCVNQPDEWWYESQQSQHYQICLNNACTMSQLGEVKDIKIEIIDCSSKGRGWHGKRKGVGWARKLMIDEIAQRFNDDAIVVSLDADTSFDEFYFQSIVDSFMLQPECQALAVPYYHPVPDGDSVARSLLYYECYMRNFHIAMLSIGSPYAFTALGSAMAFTVAAYRRVGGITPLQGGEDFYLLQKFVKTSLLYLTPMGQHANHAVVYPLGRSSERVPFGTGPAVALPIRELQKKYPYYPQRAFEEVQATCKLFPRLYDEDVETPMTCFLAAQLKTNDLWSMLRKNFKSRDKFVHACYERVDGLRILQYLRSTDYPFESPVYNGRLVDFEMDEIGLLNEYRNSLCECERRLSPPFLSTMVHSQ